MSAKKLTFNVNNKAIYKILLSHDIYITHTNRLGTVNLLHPFLSCYAKFVISPILTMWI